jgi:hypothetical protein
MKRASRPEQATGSFLLHLGQTITDKSTHFTPQFWLFRQSLSAVHAQFPHSGLSLFCSASPYLILASLMTTEVSNQSVGKRGFSEVTVGAIGCGSFQAVARLIWSRAWRRAVILCR